ncbi:MAG: 50S ribosomal protein L16 [Phycisphaerae bacterium]|jgi:large subunit ribosomal protein L16|nr:50S ribosomal protein L16 [Phycisphaerae bacterium]
MAMMPKRVKYRKFHKGRIHGKATRGNTVAYGEFGLQTLEAGRITAQQIEAGRMAATHYLRREGRVFIRIFPHTSYTGKPLEVRMGKGKGEVVGWIAKVKPGTVLFEIGGVPEETAKAAFSRVAQKMPVMVRFVTRQHTV